MAATMTAQRQHPTQPQIAKLYTVAGQAGLDHAGVKDELFARYGIDSTKQLSTVGILPGGVVRGI